MTINFLYEHIFIQFGCPLTINNDQGIHFCNNVIKYLTDHFILNPKPQGNGQTKSTNKVFGTSLKEI
jgi:hypothetical protein